MVQRQRKVECLREKLSKLYLDVAEKIPKLERGWIARLQRIRERQNEKAKGHFAKSKRPEGNDLTLSSIYVYELYFLGDFPKLEQSLSNIYVGRKGSGFSKGRIIDGYKGFIDRASRYFSFGSWQNLGIIAPIEKGKYRPFSIEAYLEDFPKEIESIQLQLYHILPSVIVVSFNVAFNKDVNQAIESIINTKKRGKIVFDSFFPWKYGRTERMPREEKAKAIHSYLVGIRKDTETFISRYFKGYFLSNRHNHKLPQCPCVEIFNISGMPEDEDLDNKIELEREFWESLGFEWYYKFGIFRADNVFFFDASVHTFHLDYPYRILVVKKGLDTKAFSSIEDAIHDKAFWFLRGFTNSIVLLELCNGLMEHAMGLRFTIAKRLSAKQFVPGWLKRLLYLNEDIDRESFVLDELIAEYQEIKENALSEWKREQTTIEQIEKKRISEGHQKELADYFLERINWQLDLIKRQDNVTKESFKRYLFGLNIGISYKLQRRIFWLTFLLVVGLLVQIFLAVIPGDAKYQMWTTLLNVFKQ